MEKKRIETVFHADDDFCDNETQDRPYTRAELEKFMEGLEHGSGSAAWDFITGRQVIYENFSGVWHIFCYSKLKSNLYSKQEISGYKTKEEAKTAALDYMMTGVVPSTSKSEKAIVRPEKH